MPCTTSAVYFKDNSPLWATAAIYMASRSRQRKSQEQTGDLRCGLCCGFGSPAGSSPPVTDLFPPTRNLTPHEQITTAKNGAANVKLVFQLIKIQKCHTLI